MQNVGAAKWVLNIYKQASKWVFFIEKYMNAWIFCMFKSKGPL